MSKEKKSFVFYTEWLEQLKLIATCGTPEDMVSLCDGLESFVETGDVEELTPLATAVFNPMRHQIKRDTTKWIETSKKNSENGKKGADAKRSKREQANASEDKRPQAKTSIDEDVDDDVDGDVDESTVVDNTLSVTERDLKSEFETVWRKYPRKVGRKDAYRHYKSARKHGTTFDEVYNGVLKYAEAMQGQDEQYIAHGSAWFNGHRWEDDVSPHKPRPHNPTMAELHQLPIIDPFAELRGAT